MEAESGLGQVLKRVMVVGEWSCRGAQALSGRQKAPKADIPRALKDKHQVRKQRFRFQAQRVVSYPGRVLYLLTLRG